MFMNYERFHYDLDQKWSPLPGSLVVIKGWKEIGGMDGNAHYLGNPTFFPKSRRAKQWEWVLESVDETPVLLLGYTNPWYMKILSKNGIYETHLDNLKFIIFTKNGISKE